MIVKARTESTMCETVHEVSGRWTSPTIHGANRPRSARSSHLTRVRDDSFYCAAEVRCVYVGRTAGGDHYPFGADRNPVACAEHRAQPRDEGATGALCKWRRAQRG